MKKLHSIAAPAVLSALLLLACQGSPTSPVNSPDPDISGRLGVSNGIARATGGGSTLEFGEKTTFGFTAILHRDGSVKGQLQYQFRTGDVGIHISVDCLKIVGNRATLSGSITHVTGNPHSLIFKGQKAVFMVEDNGEGSGDPPDRVSNLFPYAEATCAVFPYPLPYLPVDGNIQVVGASS